MMINLGTPIPLIGKLPEEMGKYTNTTLNRIDIEVVKMVEKTLMMNTTSFSIVNVKEGIIRPLQLMNIFYAQLDRIYKQYKSDIEIFIDNNTKYRERKEPINLGEPLEGKTFNGFHIRNDLYYYYLTQHYGILDSILNTIKWQENESTTGVFLRNAIKESYVEGIEGNGLDNEGTEKDRLDMKGTERALTKSQGVIETNYTILQLFEHFLW